MRLVETKIALLRKLRDGTSPSAQLNLYRPAKLPRSAIKSGRNKLLYEYSSPLYSIRSPPDKYFSHRPASVLSAMQQYGWGCFRSSAYWAARAGQLPARLEEHHGELISERRETLC